MREIYYRASEEIRVKFNDSKTLPEVPTIVFRRILNVTKNETLSQERNALFCVVHSALKSHFTVFLK